MKALRKLYTANLDNEVVLFATNLKDFIEAFDKLEPSANVRNYAYYRREFMKTSIIPFTVKNSKIYNLQEVYKGD